MKVKNINMQHIITFIRTALVIYNTYKDDAEIYSKLELIVYDDRNTDIEYLQQRLSEFHDIDHDGHDDITLLNNDTVILLCSQMKMLNMTERKIVVKLVQKGILNVAKTSDVEKFIKDRFTVITQEEAEDPVIQLMLELVK